MEKKVIDFLSKIEGFKTRIKEVHWVASSISGHELAGDIEDALCEFEDSLAEDLQGVFGEDIEAKELKPIEAKSRTMGKLISEILSETTSFYKSLDGDKYIGARSEIEGFIHTMNVKRYLGRKTVNEAKKSNKETISESKMRDMKKAVLAELSSKFYDSAYNAALKAKDSATEKDEYGNDLDKHGNVWADRIRKYRRASDRAFKKETNERDLPKLAKQFWEENELEDCIEWDESDWITSHCETYGPTSGFVKMDGWEFIVAGNQEGDDVNIDTSEGIEFTTPDGENGVFFLYA